jgi:tetratricopeptide (TPR) repeat protein
MGSGTQIVLAAAAAGALTFFLAVPTAQGHADPDVEIADLTRRIEASPSDASLYLKRGELYRFRRDWQAAFADYHAASRLAPQLAAVDLARALAFHGAGLPVRALEAVDRFLAKHPEHVPARIARARILVRLGRRVEAAADYTRAIAAASIPGGPGAGAPAEWPEPEYYLERAQVLAAEGGQHIAEAIRGLDEGIAKLGPAITLELAAVDLELERGQTQRAIARLESIEARSRRKESYRARRGEILERAGRLTEARRAYAEALSALDTLPDWKRKARTMEKLRASVESALDRLSRASERDGAARGSQEESIPRGGSGSDGNQKHP